MQAQDMHFLDARRTAMWHADVDVGSREQLGHHSTVAPSEPDDRHLAFVGSEYRFDDAARIPAGGDRQQYIPWVSQGANLFGEYLVVLVIIGDGGKDRAVGRERDGGQGRPFDFEAIDEFSGEMLCITGRTAVAARKNLPFIHQALKKPLRGLAENAREDL